MVPQAEARAAIEERIRKGEMLLTAPGSEDELQAMHEEYYSWSESNRDLLARLFSDTSIAEGYYRTRARVMSLRPEPLHRRIAEFHDDDRYRLRKLRSVLGRLELFDTSAWAATLSKTVAETSPSAGQSRAVFIIHGHDRAAALELQKLRSSRTRPTSTRC